MVPSGYSSLLAPLARTLDVRLSCPVALIQDDSDGVQVTTASGAHRKSWAKARIAQTTPPSPHILAFAVIHTVEGVCTFECIASAAVGSVCRVLDGTRSLSTLREE